MRADPTKAARPIVKAKPPDLPPAVASAFVKDMKAFFAEKNRYKQDEIALRQLHAIKEHQGPRENALRLSDVKQMFLEIKGMSGEKRPDRRACDLLVRMIIFWVAFSRTQIGDLRGH
jgi:hypothetical protein